MKITTYKTTRLSASTPNEKDTVRSWGSSWQYFGRLERNGKPILLIFGDWSGYRSSQYQITHVDVAGYYGNYKEKISPSFRGHVRFTDGTTMTVWVKAVTRADILEQGLKRRENYRELINKLITSGKTFYDVGACDC